jgi:predicted amidohydrolase
MKITIVQSDIFWEDKTANLSHLDQMLSRIGEPTDLIVLPETFNTGFSMNTPGLSEGAKAETFLWLTSRAKKLNAAICGSYMVNEDGKYYNRFLFADPAANVISYDKRHLFSIGGEDKSFTGGNRRVTFSYREMRINPVICYDLRFPVWLRNRNDYDLLVCVANWPESRREVWKTLLKARAIENQSYVAGVNRVGVDGDGNSYAGESVIIDPKGNILVQLPEYSEDIATVEISLKDLEAFRKKFPVWKDADDFMIS